MAKSSPSLAWHTFSAALAYANEQPNRGSIAGFNPQVIASFCRVSVDEVRRVIQALRELGILIGERIAKWTKRQTEKVEGRTTGAERTDRCRRNKAARAAQGVLDLGVPALQATVTSAAEEEGAQRIPESISNTESVAAREGLDENEVDSFGRDAPLTHPLGSSAARRADNVVPFADGPQLKAQKKEMRRQKVMRFIHARYAGEERSARMIGMCGGDPVRDEQWWFDKCDAERILAGWDDVRDRRSSWQWSG